MDSQLSNEFWTKPLTKTYSTFGATEKPNGKYKLDDGYAITRMTGNWSAQDQYNVSRARLKVERMYGKLFDTPSPAHYTPNHEAISKRENIAPLFTIATRPRDRYLEDLKDLQNTRSEIAFLNRLDQQARAKKKKSKLYKIAPGEFTAVSIEDMKLGKAI